MDYVFGILMFGGGVLTISAFVLRKWASLGIRIGDLSDELTDEDDREEYEQKEKLAWRLGLVGLGMIAGALAVYGLEQLF
jgi:hypothetical protein